MLRNKNRIQESRVVQNLESEDKKAEHNTENKRKAVEEIEMAGGKVPVTGKEDDFQTDQRSMR